MCAFNKSTIYLRDCIKVTNGILNQEIAPTGNIDLKHNNVFGEESTFNFNNTMSNQSIPIEQLGLAQLSYLSAISTFHTKRIAEDKTESYQFEKLDKDSSIADFVDNISPEVFTFYTRYGERIGRPYLTFGKAFTGNLNGCKNVFDREYADGQVTTAIKEGFFSALNEYVDTLKTEEECFSKQEEERIIIEESNLFHAKMILLKNHAENIYGSSQGSYENTSDLGFFEPLENN